MFPSVYVSGVPFNGRFMILVPPSWLRNLFWNSGQTCPCLSSGKHREGIFCCSDCSYTYIYLLAYLDRRILNMKLAQLTFCTAFFLSQPACKTTLPLTCIRNVVWCPSISHTVVSSSCIASLSLHILDGFPCIASFPLLGLFFGLLVLSFIFWILLMYAPALIFCCVTLRHTLPSILSTLSVRLMRG